MDGQRFDNFTRLLAGGTSRRRLLRAAAGTAAGGLLGLVGLREAVGQLCRDAGRTCTSNGNCCSGFCATENPDPFKRNRCACPPDRPANCRGACKNPATDYQSDVLNCGGCDIRCPIDQCNQATCSNGVCGKAANPARVGKACDDGNLCTEGDVCQANGACQGSPKNCLGQSDQCNDGVCRAADGACVKQPRQNGSGCETGNRCTADTCQNGICTQGPVNVPCPAPAPCQESVSCNPANGLCDVIVNRPNGFACETGNRCTADACNGQGACVQGQVNVTCLPTQCQQSVSCNPANGLCDQIVNKSNGTPCGNPTSCANGVTHAQDTCDGNGACVPGADTSCGLGESCVGTTCQPACLDLQVACDPSNNRCCQDELTLCEDVPSCGAGAQCCHITGEGCSTSCDCCGADVCPSGRCCHPEGAECNIFAVEGCCEGFACDGGFCRPSCRLGGASCSPFAAERCCPGFECIGEVCRPVCTGGARRCGAETDCCPSGRTCCGETCCAQGEHCINGACGCLTAQAACDPANNLCCQQEETFCLDSAAGGYWPRQCCHPVGGTCGGDLDCCRNHFRHCSSGQCGGNNAFCSFHEDCVSGYCFGICSNVSPLRDCFDSSECPDGGLCIQRECRRCPGGFHACGGECCLIGVACLCDPDDTCHCAS